VDQLSETPAAEVGATSIGKVIWESAAWIEKARGGTVAVLDAPNVLVDPINSLFGATLTLQADALGGDTVVTIATSQETFPSLPVAFEIAMPVVRISLNGEVLAANATATIALPVLASYDPDTARVFHLLNNNSWEEITPLTPIRHLNTEPSLHQRVSFESSLDDSSTFVLVIDLPLRTISRTKKSSCGILQQKVFPGEDSNVFDGLFFLLPVLALILRRWRLRAE
jgi:hypothetical protein